MKEITINELDEQYEKFQTMIQSEKNKNEILSRQLKKARAELKKLNEEAERQSEEKLLEAINKNALAVKATEAAIEREAERRKKQENKERVIAEMHYRSCQRNIKCLAITISIAALIVTACVMLKAENQTASYIAIGLSGASIGYFINDFVRLAGKRGIMS